VAINQCLPLAAAWVRAADTDQSLQAPERVYLTINALGEEMNGV